MEREREGEGERERGGGRERGREGGRERGGRGGGRERGREGGREGEREGGRGHTSLLLSVISVFTTLLVVTASFCKQVMNTGNTGSQ